VQNRSTCRAARNRCCGSWSLALGKNPLLLLTNLCGVRDSQSLGWIAPIYLTRWKIEETFRFVKQSYPLEDIRVLRYQRLKNLVLLMTAAAYFATAF
jgi:hypothetical protein